MTDVSGRGVAVIDLRRMLGLPSAPATKNTRILVAEVPGAGRGPLLGLVADRVFEGDGTRRCGGTAAGARHDMACGNIDDCVGAALARLARITDAAPACGDKPIASEVMASVLRDRYTMASERAVHHHVLAGPATAPDVLEDMLF